LSRRIARQMRSQEIIAVDAQQFDKSHRTQRLLYYCATKWMPNWSTTTIGFQQAMPERDTGVVADSRIELRIGINLGDVIVEGDDLYGDGVNIAARMEALADAGGVFVSNTVHDHVRDRLPFAFEDLGKQQVKNIARPVCRRRNIPARDRRS
jgi:hypothetical protein